MKSEVIQKTLTEKVGAGWFDGCNSVKNPWIVPDTQYRWAINLVNRGGILQTRPGYRVRLTLPPGNLQGMVYFNPSKTTSKIGRCLLFAVDGKIYYSPFPLVQPLNWETQRLSNIQFDPSAPQIFWCVGEKTATTTVSGEITVIPSYRVLVMQDNRGTAAAYFDGEFKGHLNASAPLNQTPSGGPMIWSGNRLWVAYKNLVMASDLADPLTFTERLTDVSRGDFKFAEDVTGFAMLSSPTINQDILVFTATPIGKLTSSIIDRQQWQTTPNFQSAVTDAGGCVAPKSIIQHCGLIWWYSSKGLKAMDPSTLAYVTSESRLRDFEMGYSKRNLAPDTSRICSASFEDYLLVSVPSGDTLNAHTQVMDYSVGTEPNSRGNFASRSWNGIWTGTRPVEWVTVESGGGSNIYQASVDYQSFADGSFNHVWEAFMPERFDSYEVTDAGNVVRLIENPIYWAVEFKMMGDGMDLKKFRFAEFDLCEIGGIVNLVASYCGTKGGYNEILRKRIVATINGNGINNDDAQRLWNAVGDFQLQSRRVSSREALIPDDFIASVETKDIPQVSKWFGILLQGCGRCGIESYRLFFDPVAESSVGGVEADETGANIVTPAGQSFHFDE